METYVRVVSALSRAAAFIAAGLVVAAIAVICQMLVIRHGLGRSAIWQNEFVTFALVAATFLAAPYVLIVRGHVVVELVPIWLSGRARRTLGMIAGGLGFVFCLLVFVTSLEWWWEAFSLDLRTSTMWRARLWIPYLSLPVGSLLLTLQYIAELWEIATERKPAFGNPHEVGP